MTKDEFIQICTKCGYATKGVSTVYAKGKTELTEDDFIEVFRIYEKILAFKSGNEDERFSSFENGRTTRKISDDPNQLV
jgi:hypothetical protein